MRDSYNNFSGIILLFILVNLLEATFIYLSGTNSINIFFPYSYSFQSLIYYIIYILSLFSIIIIPFFRNIYYATFMGLFILITYLLDIIYLNINQKELSLTDMVIMLVEAKNYSLNVINHYYRAKGLHPNIPFYLQDENGDTYEFGWSLIYQYIAKLTQ